MAKSKGIKGNPPSGQMRLELAPPKQARILAFTPKATSASPSRASELDALKRVLAHAESLGKKT